MLHVETTELFMASKTALADMYLTPTHFCCSLRVRMFLQKRSKITAWYIDSMNMSESVKVMREDAVKLRDGKRVVW